MTVNTASRLPARHDMGDLDGYENSLIEAIRDPEGDISPLALARLVDVYRRGKIGLGNDAFEALAAAEMLLASTIPADHIPSWGELGQAVLAVTQRIA